MQAVSSLFLPALREAHLLAVTATAYGTTLAGPQSLPVSGGEVTVENNAAVRARLNLNVDDRAFFPKGSGDPLAPYGSEVRVRRGITWPDGTAETLPLGVFRVENVSLDADAGTVTISGSDRMAQVADERFTTPFLPTRYARHVDVLAQLVRAVYPNVSVILPAIASTIGAPVFDEDRVGAIQELATAIGCDAYFDETGRFVVALIPEPSSATYVWEADASPTGVLTGATRRLARDGAYNGVVARGQDLGQDGLSVSSLVTDTRAGSPTYWGGPFGKVPRFYSSPLITTAAQATSAATRLLYRSTGIADSVEATCIPNPALQVGDPVRVTWPDGGKTIHLIDAMTIPLGVDATMTLRSKRAVELTP